MLKIRTHKDAFKAYLAPEKYDHDGCVFCYHTDYSCDKCVVEFYCYWKSEIGPYEWPDIPDEDRAKIIRYLLRTCKKWGRSEIERLARKKAIALAYKFERRRNDD